MKRSNEFAVGLAVLTALALVIGGALWLSETDVNQKEATYTARFRTVGGLGVGAPVTLRGRYYGAWLLTHSVGVVLGPGLGTALYAVSPGGLWAGCVGLGLVGALLVLASPRPAEPRSGATA